VTGVRRQPFDGRDLLAPDGRHLRLAGSHRPAVDMDRTGAVWPAKAS